jgi:NO-binding membrane sensor protein with MHYT domain
MVFLLEELAAVLGLGILGLRFLSLQLVHFPAAEFSSFRRVTVRTNELALAYVTANRLLAAIHLHARS